MNTISLLVNFLRLHANIKKSRKEVLKLQERALRKILKYAFENSAYYHKTFSAAGITRKNISTMPISNFPTIDKNILMQNFDEIVTTKDLKQSELAIFAESENVGNGLYKNKYHIVHSSGSTGTPRYFVYDNEAWNKTLLGITRGALWGMSISEMLALLKNRPKILYVAATDGLYGGAMSIGDAIDNLPASKVFLDIAEPFENWKEVFAKNDFDVIIGYPSAIKILCEKFIRNLRLLPSFADAKLEATNFASVKRVITCGEPLSSGLRNFIQQKFDCDVINFYGASETLPLGVEGNPDDGMLLFDDLNYVEVVDGKMYVTCLYNFSQPLIRYNITDSLELLEDTSTAGNCVANTFGMTTASKCNFTKSRVVLSRNEDVMWFKSTNGESHFLHPLSVEGLCVEGLIDYQFVKISDTEFKMKIQLAPNANENFVSTSVKEILNPLIMQKKMDFVRYSIEAVNEIKPNPATGKKQLVINKECHSDRSGGIFQEKDVSTMLDMTSTEKTMERILIENKTFDEERALYFSKNADIKNCVFAGPADGESVLKESRDVNVSDCQFSLRYPLWHVKKFSLENSTMDELTRAALWYSDDGKISGCTLGGIKAVRECNRIEIKDTKIVSPEFGWKSSDISLENSELESEYVFMDSKNISLKNVQMKGKYSFQYIDGLTIEDSVLDTKDAFWHSRNITVKNSVVKGEYLAWFSENLTLINCKIIGTQPLCYCKNLRLENCTMEGCDLAFEYSDVQADVVGHIDSVKNPKSGVIECDCVGEVIFGDATMECNGKVNVRECCKCA